MTACTGPATRPSLPLTLTSWGHSAVTVEADGAGRLVIDPGSLCDPHVMDGLTGDDAVLVTHAHPDHLVPERVVAALVAHPGLGLWAPRAVVDELVGRAHEACVDPARLHTVAAGDAFSAAGHTVLVVGGEHAEIHPDLPGLANVGYVVDGALLHPGDSFPQLPDDVTPRILLLPVAAPWLRLAVAVDYARQLGSEVVVPVHDAILSAPGQGIVDNLVGSVLAVAGYRRRAVGDATTL